MMRDHLGSAEGKTVSSVRKDDAVRLWQEIVRTSGIKESVLADAVPSASPKQSMSPGYFSKVSSGQQGDLLGLVLALGETYPDLRRDFLLGLADLEEADARMRAAQQLTQAAMDFLLVHADALPKKRMARAGLSVQASRRTA